MANIYYKFAPNVFVAKCDEKYIKGDIINLTTKYGKELQTCSKALGLTNP